MTAPTLFDVKFQALRNALYHKARQRRLDWWARAANLVTILLGSAAAAKAFGFGPAYSEVLIGFLVAAVGAFQLVYDWSNKARTHEFLQRRYYEVLAKIEESGEADDGLPVRINAELIRIYAEEPPTLRALDSIAYNEALDGLGSKKADRLIVSWWQSLLKHSYAFAESHFETYREREIRLGAREKSHG